MDFVNINEFNDVELASRMRDCNFEKFKSLVRMHLSFELELNTDEFDLDTPCHEIVYEDKGKLKKWNRLPKKHRLGHSGSIGVPTACASRNSPSECLQKPINPGFQMHLQELKEFLMLEKNLIQEGLFRKTGSVSRQNELRVNLQHEKSLHLGRSGFSAHDCATVFKSFLSELPEPLLTDAHYPIHLQIAPMCQALATRATFENQQHLLSSIQLLMLLLPEDNRVLLHHIIEMLHAVAQHESVNKMSAGNLATLFTPHLICPRNLPPEVLHYTAKQMSSIITYMILRGLEIFAVPTKLATDIRAYFLERKRKKTMSPEQMLDESVSDISTVETVFTFVDRAATAAVTNTNTTTELAQLYAHIQSMPESSKKRRLIKQFNKQNGQGTPLQLVVMNRLKNNEATRGAKSLGDSIKKHIFHKGIMSRTPKRAPAVLSIGTETPNLSEVKQPKLRVLFQSPTTVSVACSSSTTTSAAISTNPLHPLQKSISSTSLETNFTSSSSSYSGRNASALISRQQSNVLSAVSVEESDENTSLKLITTADKQLTRITEKKSVVWGEHHLLDVGKYNSPRAPAQKTSIFKSEPNLSNMLPQVLPDHNGLTPIVEMKSLTRKIMKGVSMGNLRIPFSTPETSKRLVRSVSASLKLRSDTTNQMVAAGSYADIPLLEDIDNNEIELETESEEIDEDSDDDNGESGLEGSGTSNDLPMSMSVGYEQLVHNSENHNMDLITSTPAILRRSMSPITKSTQRMSKAMQESIMTPRSRKPVIVFNGMGNVDATQTHAARNILSLSDKEKKDPLDRIVCKLESPLFHSKDTMSVSGYVDLLRSRRCIGTTNELQEHISGPNDDTRIGYKASDIECDSLSNDFKEYLLARSLLTNSPGDLSFASRSDDFGPTTHDIDDFDESEFSPSLLYCLDGNEPTNTVALGDANVQALPPGSTNTARKRGACSSLKTPIHKYEDTQQDRLDEHVCTKKLLIVSQELGPGETAL
ncbi:uncharacterized protein LOC115634708 [Scaptodrosophila lebanonensis]|uniref:Uncharacterized protein LOC115634708 n=1 Tax=Drosophila lebanonensis TaxID=7225 RepID=A0A6J2UM07_DROLE|nr:uncharacterized protein LOC115634708 [Scaptodrosophila lebanonensis]